MLLVYSIYSVAQVSNALEELFVDKEFKKLKDIFPNKCKLLNYKFCNVALTTIIKIYCPGIIIIVS